MKISKLIIFILLLNTNPLCTFSQIKKNENKNISNDSNSKEDRKSVMEIINRAESLQTLLDTTNKNLNDIKSKAYKKQNISSIADYINGTSKILALSVLVFGFLLIISILIFLYKLQRGFGDFAFQIIGLIIVVTGSLFLIVTGYNNDQITPVIGLLGTIVGFIFGSNLNPKSNRKTESDQKDNLNKEN